MNNIQRVIVLLVISGAAWVLLDPWFSNSYSSGFRTDQMLLWLVITAVTGFFLFRTKKSP